MFPLSPQNEIGMVERIFLTEFRVKRNLLDILRRTYCYIFYPLLPAKPPRKRIVLGQFVGDGIYRNSVFQNNYIENDHASFFLIWGKLPSDEKLSFGKCICFSCFPDFKNGNPLESGTGTTVNKARPRVINDLWIRSWGLVSESSENSWRTIIDLQWSKKLRLQNNVYFKGARAPLIKNKVTVVPKLCAHPILFLAPDSCSRDEASYKGTWHNSEKELLRCRTAVFVQKERTLKVEEFSFQALLPVQVL